jgi:hypothetical protein
MKGIVTRTLFLLAGAACGVYGQSQSAHVGVVVLLYSGRPNPAFEISNPQDIEDLRTRVRDLPRTENPHWPALPPCGFLLSNHDVADFPQEVRLCRGVIGIYQNGSVDYFRDTRSLNEWLVAQTRTRGINPESHQ